MIFLEYGWVGGWVGGWMGGKKKKQIKQTKERTNERTRQDKSALISFSHFPPTHPPTPPSSNLPTYSSMKRSSPTHTLSPSFPPPSSTSFSHSPTASNASLIPSNLYSSPSSVRASAVTWVGGWERVGGREREKVECGALGDR